MSSHGLCVRGADALLDCVETTYRRPRAPFVRAPNTEAAFAELFPRVRPAPAH